jgi:hypothetical protein
MVDQCFQLSGERSFMLKWAVWRTLSVSIAIPFPVIVRITIFIFVLKVRSVCDRSEGKGLGIKELMVKYLCVIAMHTLESLLKFLLVGKDYNLSYIRNANVLRL